ncbi:hypothetical protein BDZ89DRAFT_1136176 [Hymenopellis radicata]|nr:hypothetical protein BDZ89DRAFT_1136176 [Hymenopellis radicata]
MSEASGPVSEGTLMPLHQGFVPVACALALGGLQTGLAAQSFYILVSGGIRRVRARAHILAVVVLLWASSTVFTVLYVHSWRLRLRNLGPKPNDIHAFLVAADLANIWIARLIYYISGAIVVWRAWVLWPYSRTIRRILVLCTAVTLASGLTDVIITTLVNLDVYPREEASKLNLGLLMSIPLLATNAISTFFIGLKVWYYRREVKAFISKCGGLAPTVENILLLLVESGLLYTVFWILYVLSDYDVFPDAIFQDTWQIVVIYVAAIHPMAIILAVTHHRSHEHAIKSGAELLSKSVHFVPQNTVGTVSDMRFHSIDSPAVHPESSPMHKETFTLV